MKYKLLSGLFFWMLLFSIACSEEIEFDSPATELRFSADTIFCDTVFNQVRSETYAVKVFNSENKNVNISNIQLEGGSSSLYRINVDGRSGTQFSNIPLRAKDSLYIFIEIAPKSNAPVSIAEDNILFHTTSGEKKVTLFSVVEDAEFFISSKDNPNILTENTTWTPNKAKVIFGELNLAEGKTLTIEKGTKVYFHKNSGLKISKNAQLITHGDLGKEVIFRGDRHDPRYDTLPANWNGIQIEENAKVDFNYTKLMGGTTGLELYKAIAHLKNTIIYTFQEFGIKAIASQVKAENLLMNDAGTASFGIFQGGNYDIAHSTIINYWKNYSNLNADALYVSNLWEDGKNTHQGAVDVKLKNSILYSERENAVVFQPSEGQTFNYSIQNCLIKYNERYSGFQWENNANITSSILNENPMFLNLNLAKLNLRIEEQSPAKAKGNITVAQQTPLDYGKTNRTSQPSLGAYQ
ncbi:hypothetical protein [Elizabethkingia sp. JS20170427COW]|uniref:hypothetical protein n=1 Tax=Elizabethkingia sp. JS20170427COW TaxID=2583851 RepID=UPI001110A464|nr:hypothetical protein [Elizabethkingia sp. JS20170427COW]QCX52952.1 hypothetical protein FGE20_03960 [Elizabethkingia sp. JS20170427COW]